MMRHLFALLLIAWSAQVQDRIPTHRFTLSTSYSGPIATISPSGEVKIDWERTEAVITDANADPRSVVYARVMLAIRDGTWKPMENR